MNLETLLTQLAEHPNVEAFTMTLKPRAELERELAAQGALTEPFLADVWCVSFYNTKTNAFYLGGATSPMAAVREALKSLETRYEA